MDNYIPPKICSKCLVPKNRSEFSPDPKNRDGLYPQCKTCKAKTRRQNYIPRKKVSISDRFWKNVNKSDDNNQCWLWTAGTVDGYGTIRINGKKMKAHRLSYEINIGEIPDGLWVLHKCDIRNCVNPNHLFLGTHQDNMDDMHKKGRHKVVRGEDHPNHILTEEKIDEIHRLWKTDQYTQIEIGKIIGISNVTVSQIVRNDSWKHLNKD